MATCSNCQNSDYDPDNPCCPDSVPLVNAVMGKDRSCKTKRIETRKGILASASGKAGFMDGSSSQPLNLNLEGVESVDGGVVVQTPSGRILLLVPNGEAAQSAVLQLVYDGSVLKFVEVTAATAYLDSEVAVTDASILASWGCAADGRIKLSKFIPGCEGLRHLVIDAEGNVTCDEVEVGACRTVTAVDELDSLWGCANGIFSPILPVLGKTLIGAGDPVKWTLGEASSGIQLISPRVQLATGGYAGVNNGIMHTSNISWAAQPGYLASYRYVIVRGIAQLSSRGMDTVGELRMDGQNLVSVKVREHPTLTCDHDTNGDQQILHIPGGKVSLLEFVLTDLGNSQANALNEASFNMYLEGWVS